MTPTLAELRKHLDGAIKQLATGKGDEISLKAYATFTALLALVDAEAARQARDKAIFDGAEPTLAEVRDRLEDVAGFLPGESSYWDALRRFIDSEEARLADPVRFVAGRIRADNSALLTRAERAEAERDVLHREAEALRAEVVGLKETILCWKNNYVSARSLRVEVKSAKAEAESLRSEAVTLKAALKKIASSAIGRKWARRVAGATLAGVSNAPDGGEVGK